MIRCAALKRMPAKPTSIDAWIKRTLREDPPRSKSLIITIFGDSLLPYLSGIWLSELTSLLEPFQVNAQLVRTSGFRLADEGWLESYREGRRSRYSLTASGRQKIEHAYTRIYEPIPQDWDGNWTMVLLSKAGNAHEDRTELRLELEWEGFGLLASGIFVHPRANITSLQEILKRLKLLSSVVVMQARYSDLMASRPASMLAAECWNLEVVADLYVSFVKRFSPLLPSLDDQMDPETAYVVQTLLIHSFRRVVLHDPRLPAELLPRVWPGHAAYDLCQSIYSKTLPQTRHYLANHLEQGSIKTFKLQR